MATSDAAALGSDPADRKPEDALRCPSARSRHEDPPALSIEASSKTKTAVRAPLQARRRTSRPMLHPGFGSPACSRLRTELQPNLRCTHCQNQIGDMPTVRMVARDWVARSATGASASAPYPDSSRCDVCHSQASRNKPITQHGGS